MTEEEYMQMLARMGKVGGTLKGLDAGGVSAAQKMGKPAPPPQLPRELVIVGQMPSGKNQVRTAWTKNKKKPGKMKPHKYPDKRFAAWRDVAAADLWKQWKSYPIGVHVRLHCMYWPGDRRTRDVSGMADALLHVLVCSNILIDDELVWDLLWYRQPMNRKGPKVLITVQEWGA